MSLRRSAADRSCANRPLHDSRGQSLVEFALIFPLMLILVVGIADFGRIYVAAVAVEAAAREAADYGAFNSSYWLVDGGTGTDNPPITKAEMERRACTAAAGSHLEGYAEPAGTVGHSTCTNPAMTCTLVNPDGTEVACETYPGGVCHVSTTDPPCLVHVELSYEFRTILQLPLVPGSITLTRHSRFAVSDLTP